MSSNGDTIHFNYTNWRTVNQYGNSTLEGFVIGRELREILSNSEKRILYFSSLGNIVNEILEHMMSEGFYEVARFNSIYYGNVLIVAPTNHSVSGYRTIGNGTNVRYRLYRSINRDDNLITSFNGATMNVWFVECVVNNVTDEHDIEILQGNFPINVNVSRILDKREYNMNRAFKVNQKDNRDYSILLYRGGENGKW